MEKLILDNTRDENDYYQLEINDNGDYIEFDLTDIGLAERIMNAGDKIHNLVRGEQEEIKKIEEEKDEMVKARKLIKLSSEMDREKRKLFDSFLGEGTCDKIFGQKKNEEQYFKLLEALEPHFKKMNLQLRKAKQKLANKYLPKDEDVM